MKMVNIYQIYMKNKLKKLNKKLIATFCNGDYKANKRLQKKIYQLKDKICWSNIRYDITPEEIAYREGSNGGLYYHE